MQNKENAILADCPLFACLECHTKSGYPHQSWCTLTAGETPGCECCIYWRGERKKCGHPYRKKRR